MERGKSLKIFIMDGVPNGRWICELSNWTGKAYKIPRTSYKKCVDREELRSPAIYFLFGEDDESGKPLIYIGETEDAIKRLGTHIQDERMNYWVEAIVFISKDDHLNKAHIKYLESRFHGIAKEVDRYKAMNANSPTKSSISEAEECEMEEFIDNAKIIVSALGHKAFEPLLPEVRKNTIVEKNEESEKLYLKTNKGASAVGMVVSEGFIVLKDSTINTDLSKKFTNQLIIKLRESYKKDGVIVDNVLTKNTLFSSPSAAASFVCGHSASGPRSWKTVEGKTLKELGE